MERGEGGLLIKWCRGGGLERESSLGMGEWDITKERPAAVGLHL